MSELSNDLLITKDDSHTNANNIPTNMKPSIQKENQTKAVKRKKQKRRKQSDPVVNSIAALLTTDLNIVSPEKCIRSDQANEIVSVEETDSLKLNESKKKRKSKLSLKDDSVVIVSPGSGKTKFKECSQQGNLNAFLKFTSPVKNTRLDEVKDDDVELEESSPLKVSLKLFSPKRKNKREKKKVEEIATEIEDSIQINDVQDEVCKVNDSPVNCETIETKDSDDEVISKKINKRFDDNIDGDSNDKKKNGKIPKKLDERINENKFINGLLKELKNESIENDIANESELDKIIAENFKENKAVKILNKKIATKTKLEKKLEKKTKKNKSDTEGHFKLKNTVFKKKTDKAAKKVADEIIEVQTINLGKCPETPKRDVFQFMMNSRNKSIGQNPSGKSNDSPPIIEEENGEKIKLKKRRKKLEEWSNKKGGSKRKNEEVAREAYTAKVLKSRAKRMKEMLQIDSSDSSEFETKRKRTRKFISSSDDDSNFVETKKCRIDLTEETNDGEIIAKLNNSPQDGLTSFLGVLNKNEPIAFEPKKPGRKKKKILIETEEESSSDICIGKLRSELKMKININTLEIVESSLDGEEFEAGFRRKSGRAKPIRNYVEIEEDVKKKVEVKKVAPVFLKSAKTKLDLVALEARNNFLHSGVPSSLKKSIEKHQSLEDAEFKVFPSISHVQQKPDPLTEMWALSEVNLKLNEISGSPPACPGPLNKGSVSNLKIPTIKSDLQPPKPDQNCKLLLDKIKSENPDFPVYRTYRLLREKFCSAKPIMEQPKAKKRGRKKKKISEDCVIVEPKLINLMERAMWTEKYKARASSDIIGNHKAVSELKRWLQDWIVFSAEINTTKKRKRSDSSDFESFDGNSNGYCLPRNTMILEGTHGSGKTSAVYVVCCELGINVIELNASSKRTGKRLLLELQEATQSHQVRKKDSMTLFLSKKKEKAAELCLLLIEDIDIVFEQDDGFIAALSQLVLTSKRPVVLITGDIDCPHLQKFTNLYPVIKFTPLPASLLSNWLQILCLIEGLYVDKYSLAEMIESNQGDIRRSLLQLQFWTLSGGDCGSKKKNNCNLNLSRIESNYEDEPAPSLENGNADWKLHGDCFDGKLNLGTAWWNLPTILKETKELQSAADVIDAFSLTDAMRRTAGFDVEAEPRLLHWRTDLQDGLNLRENMRGHDANLDLLSDIEHSLLEGYCELYKSDACAYNMAVPNIDKRRWLKQQSDCNRSYFEVIPLSYATDRAAFATDYFPTLRTISRTEMIRSNNNSKRNNRFYNYLKSLDVNPSSSHIKTACDMLNV